jgi:hypothetical protein
MADGFLTGDFGPDFDEDDLVGLVPTTELDAVNLLLFIIGESPLASLDPVTAPAAVTSYGDAIRMLRREARALQMKGWSFNTDLCVTLTPAPNGYVIPPTNTLSMRFVGADLNGSLAFRKGYVWDRREQTFVLQRNVQADLIRLWPFEQLPEEARHFVMIRAARKFQDGWLGDDSLHRFEERDELTAWADFLSREAEDNAYNVNRDSPSAARVTMARYRYIT